ncbi:MAG: ECF transporter S component [Chloroflexota bacterium]|nr:ECF transporter S component [Chloroflexota bacterium]
MTLRRLIGGAIYALSAAIGILAFVYPFFAPLASQAAGTYAHGQNAPLLTAALVALSVVALLVELQGHAINAKTVAMLGVLVAVTSVLRFLEVAFPMPGGFSPVFAPIIISGYVFGGRFGYLMGTFTLLTSALITGGVGPWLPYQMFTAGWAGLTAGWLRRVTDWAGEWIGKLRPASHAARLTPSVSRSASPDVLILSVFGFIWGLLYGLVVNVYFWPFAAGPANQSWAPGIGLQETLGRYAVFYAVTSLTWDLFRAGGNVLLILFLGAPMIKTLTRFRQRFHFRAGSHA